MPRRGGRLKSIKQATLWPFGRIELRAMLADHLQHGGSNTM
ncbi:hypothetical protein C7S13_3013 [Burkholderia cepacia]|nr:hypothetical protein [Burkholderia cepacia]QOH33576.1 hypothetical protein C7S14_4703 [Burkholderia cepacia]